MTINYLYTIYRPTTNKIERDAIKILWKNQNELLKDVQVKDREIGKREHWETKRKSNKVKQILRLKWIEYKLLKYTN